MTTPLELHELRQLPELRAAERLISASTGELWAVVTLCGAKAPKRADRQELVAAILEQTHPKAARKKPSPQYQQERFV